MENMFQSQTFAFKRVSFLHYIPYNKSQLLLELYISVNLVS
jgi:hypothetical protein